MPTQTCRERISDGGRSVTSHACGRPISPDDPDGKLCKAHLTVARKRAERDTAYDDARAQDDARKAAALAACDWLATLGISATPAWEPNYAGKAASPLPSVHTGGVNIQAGSVPALLARLGLTDAPPEGTDRS
jgi:hypothetical protein